MLVFQSIGCGTALHGTREGGGTAPAARCTPSNKAMPILRSYPVVNESPAGIPIEPIQIYPSPIRALFMCVCVFHVPLPSRPF